jgi:hypothetical protein
MMRWVYLVMAALCVACSGSDRLSYVPAPPSAIHSWIHEPPVLPDGARGNNCNGRVFNYPPVGTYAFPGFAFPGTVDAEAHPDAVCWQSGPMFDPWSSGAYLYRQQFRYLHITDPNVCQNNGVPGGKCDMEGIRVCREGGAGQETPCYYPPGTNKNKTGPNGCAPCVLKFTPERP